MPKYFVKNRGEIHLSQADFKAQGGQAAIYVKGSTAYKIYTDPKGMIPAAKIQELSALTDSSIIRPQDILLDDRNRPIGYTMRHVENAYSLCQIFPKSFRVRQNLTPEIIFRLVQKLQTGVRHVHSKNILIVDLNELNLLVANNFKEVFFLDVDSYQTHSFPATALMESVRDRHAKSFNEGTDWFAFAVVSFQMFVGIHPFKGTYPPFGNIAQKDKKLDERMRRNISVLHDGVTVPATCLPFSVIPAPYLDWYKAVFEHGCRKPPPDAAQGAVVAVNASPVQRLSGSNRFDITELYEFDSEVLHHFDNITVTSKSIYIGNRKVGENLCDAKAIVTARTGHVIAACLDGGKVCFRDLTSNRKIKADVSGEEIMTTDGRLYIKRDSTLLEAEFIELPHMILLQTRAVGNLLKNATQLFEGVAIQNFVGSYYASLLPQAGICHQCRLKELDGYKIADAKFSRNVLVVVGSKNGVYDKFIFRFGEDFADYDVRMARDIQFSGINLTILDNGVCLHLNEADELEIFSRRKNSGELKIISDPAIHGDVKLSHYGAQALFTEQNKLYKFTMRQP